LPGYVRAGCFGALESFALVCCFREDCDVADLFTPRMRFRAVRDAALDERFLFTGICSTATNSTPSDRLWSSSGEARRAAAERVCRAGFLIFAAREGMFREPRAGDVLAMAGTAVHEYKPARKVNRRRLWWSRGCDAALCGIKDHGRRLDQEQAIMPGKTGKPTAREV